MNRATRVIGRSRRAVQNRREQRRQEAQAQALAEEWQSTVESLKAMAEFFRTARQEREDIVEYLDKTLKQWYEIEDVDEYAYGYGDVLDFVRKAIAEGDHRNV